MIYVYNLIFWYYLKLVIATRLASATYMTISRHMWVSLALKVRKFLLFAKCTKLYSDVRNSSYNMSLVRVKHRVFYDTSSTIQQSK
jgi:hypothetical protein